jgi:hypothetical protein
MNGKADGTCSYRSGIVLEQALEINLTRCTNPTHELLIDVRWNDDIKRIVFLDFIHRLVSQEQTKLRN